MNDLELIFSILGEASATEIAIIKNAPSFPQNEQAATEVGTVAGNSRKELEKEPVLLDGNEMKETFIIVLVE